MINNLMVRIVELLWYASVTLCHEGKPVSSPESCKCASMDSVDAINPLSVCVLTYGPDNCLGPLCRLEGVVWSSVLHVCRYDSTPV